MTTITAISGNKLTVRPSSTSEAHIALECADHDGRQFHGARVYQRKDLLAAFGIDELGCGCEEADENLDAALKRAEAAEAKLAEKATRLEIESQNAERWYRDCKDAEATIQRVRDLDWYGHYSADYVREKLAAALDPVPPFTLPTEAGARFEADRIGATYTFQTITYRIPDGGMTLYIREGDLVGFTAKEVMADFTGHRLLGAEDA
jgi:hypothetical protein